MYGPFIWVLAALTMTVGNVLALRQTNIVRMLAYSSVSQGGFILMPLAFVNTRRRRRLGAARPSSSTCSSTPSRTSARSPSSSPSSARPTAARSRSFGGLIQYAPGLAVLMTLFLASLTGIPPLGGWIAKFNAFKALLDADTTRPTCSP